MRAHRRWARGLAAGLVIVALSAAGVQAVGSDSSHQTNNPSPARNVTGSSDSLAGQVHSNRPDSAGVVQPSNIHSKLPAMSNNPALAQGGESN